MAVLAREEFTPVPPAYQARDFPNASSLPLSATKPTLIVFVHPLCPCTRASFHELEQLMADAPSRAAVTIVFTIPTGLPGTWQQGDLWKSAESLPGVQVVQDPGGVEAQRFGVHGSGHCLLYNPAGTLLFSGGITGSRGHDGENPGRLALLEWITTGRADIHQTPVFGCTLL